MGWPSGHSLAGDNFRTDHSRLDRQLSLNRHGANFFDEKTGMGQVASFLLIPLVLLSRAASVTILPSALRTSSRAGLPSLVNQRLFTTHPVMPQLVQVL